MIYRGNKLIALVPANIDLNNVYSHQGLTYGGILIQSDSKFTEYLEIFSEVLRFLKKKSIVKITNKKNFGFLSDMRNDFKDA